MAKTYKLFTYYRSSCSARVRIAAHIKGIDMQYSFIHLLKNDQNSQEYGVVNPSHSVPTLIVGEDGSEDIVIRQSIAILEYLEEIAPDSTPLLPPLSDPSARAKVRELVNIVACDIQPVTNLRIIQRIKAAEMDGSQWQKHFMTSGLQAYENVASKYSGRYSVGDTVTMADVVLAPAIDNAVRFGVDLEQMPTIKKIVSEYNKVEAFQKGHWTKQPDTPDEFKS